MSGFNLKEGCVIPKIYQGKGRSRKFMKKIKPANKTIFLIVSIIIISIISLLTIISY